MAITNTDNLPRVATTINDGGLVIAPPEAGPKVTILGTTTSTSVDLREIVLVDNAPAAIRALRHDAGNLSGYPSELSLAVEEAISAGARNIEVMKIATTSGEYNNIYTDGERYDDLARAYDVLLHQPVDIVTPVNAWLDAYSGSAFPSNGVNSISGNDPFGNARTNFGKQLSDFCYQSTKEFNTAFGVIGVRPILKVARDESWTSAPTTDTGVWFLTPSLANVQEWIDHLTKASGSDTDHRTENLMLQYLSGSVEESAGTVAAIYNSNWQSLESDQTDAFDNNGLLVDAGQYISVVAAPNRYVGSEAKLHAEKNGVSGISYINTNGAVGYAAKLSVLDPHIAVTNQVVAGQRASRAVSPTQARTLLRHRLSSFINKPQGYVVTSGITGAHNASKFTRSDFVRVSTVRITHAVADVIRDKGEPFIGKPISGPFLSALEQEIESALTRIRKTGALNGYDFTLTSTPDQQVLGEITIDMTLVPAFELIEIKSIISLTKGDAI